MALIYLKSSFEVHPKQSQNATKTYLTLDTEHTNRLLRGARKVSFLSGKRSIGPKGTWLTLVAILGLNIGWVFFFKNHLKQIISWSAKRHCLDRLA
jgi:hypothetical protein